MLEVKQIHDFLSILTLLGQLLVIFSLISFFFFYKPLRSFFVFLKSNTLLLAFIIALIATLGSLYYSEMAGFAPCNLCWLQRIFIYPQVFILGLAYFRKDIKIRDYSLLLAVIGLMFSLYHNYIYYTVKTTSLCSLSIPCVQKYIIGLEYVTIPLMALTALIMIICLMILNKSDKN